MALFTNLFLLCAICGVSIYSNPMPDADSGAEVDADQYDEGHGRAFMEDFLKELTKKKNEEVIAAWAYASNITDHNLEVQNRVANDGANYSKEKAKELRKYDYESFDDEDLKRKFKKFKNLGYSVLPEDDFKELTRVISNMESNYAKVKVCEYKNKSNCQFSLEPEITNVIELSRDPEELKYYWLEWYNKAGVPTKTDFNKYVELANKAAEMNGYRSNAESWLSEYEDDTFEEQCEAVLAQLKPFYEQIHAYVRFELRKKYNDLVPEKGPIPAHLLGNMWAQTWDAIADFTTPYPNKPILDVTEEMVKQGYTPLKMFEMGDDFFQSLNMTKLPQTFWDKSILVKPDDGRDLVCHASAWDFYTIDDVRIKQCTRVTMDQLFTVHHELGHIQYFLQYQHLPVVYREGANPGFHEAVGDVLALSVSSPKHLEKIGLLKDYVYDDEAKINNFYLTALSKLVFLPFAYTIDKYRWSIYRKEIGPSEYNSKFWEMRDKYSGIQPPVKRTENDFDAPAKYHVSADVEYLRYFVSFIVQFQFHRAACLKAGEFVPGDPEKTLSNCDIYQSAEAGNAIKAMLSLGSSKPWPDAMEVLTGTRKMDAEALLEYFQPLNEFLTKRNKENGAFVGWESEVC